MRRKAASSSTPGLSKIPSTQMCHPFNRRPGGGRPIPTPVSNMFLSVGLTLPHSLMARLLARPHPEEAPSYTPCRDDLPHPRSALPLTLQVRPLTQPYPVAGSFPSTSGPRVRGPPLLSYAPAQVGPFCTYAGPSVSPLPEARPRFSRAPFARTVPAVSAHLAPPSLGLAGP